MGIILATPFLAAFTKQKLVVIYCVNNPAKVSYNILCE